MTSRIGRHAFIHPLFPNSFMNILRKIFHHDSLHFSEVELLGWLHVMNRLKVNSVEEFMTHEIIHVSGAQP